MLASVQSDMKGKTQVVERHDINGTQSMGYSPYVISTSFTKAVEANGGEMPLKKTDYKCGLFGSHPLWLQKLAHPITYLVFYSILGILQGAYYSYLIGINNTLERRFAFKSQIASIVNMADNFGPILFGALIGYMSAKGHRPRWAAGSMILSGVACILAALPYFLFGDAGENLDDSANPDIEVPVASIDFCRKDQAGANITVCDNQRKQANVPSVALLFASNFLNGLVGTIYYSAGTSYLDDSVPREQSALYFAICSFLRGVGPVLGFVLSSFCLYLPEDTGTSPKYNQDDPRFIGAWWLGFIILCILQVIFSLPLLLFPKEMKAKSNGVEIKNSSESKLANPENGLFDAFMRLIKNPIYLMHMFSGILKWFGILGYFNYMAKYLQEQFRVSASEAALLGGSVPILLALFASLTGGIFIRYCKPRPRVLTFLMLVMELICVAFFIILMSFKCEAPLYNTTGNQNETIMNMVSSCNTDCQCTTQIFHPVCIEGTTYFSPCFAGCGAGSKLNGTADPITGLEVYENCSCAIANENSSWVKPLALEGKCGTSDNCTEQFYMYIGVLTLLYAFAFFLQTAHLLIPMRAVNPEDKTFTLAISAGACALFAFIPYRFAYAYLADSVCILWEESCNTNGNCWVYDIDLFNKMIHGVPAISCFIGCIFSFGVFVKSGSRRLAHFYDDNEGFDLVENPKYSPASSLDDLLPPVEHQWQYKAFPEGDSKKSNQAEPLPTVSTIGGNGNLPGDAIEEHRV